MAGNKLALRDVLRGDSSVEGAAERGHFVSVGVTSERLGDRYPALWMLLFQHLRDDIVFRRRLPGARLLETELAREFGVSRGPVRTVLMELERVGLATTARRKGTIVTALTSRDIRELFSVRLVLERLAAEEACSAGRPSENDLAAMSAELDRLQVMLNAGNAKEKIDADLAFHRQICVASGNTRLVHAWMDLSDQLRRVIAAVQRADASVASQEGQHRKILRALGRGDAKGAVAAITRHIEQSRSVMLTLSDREDNMT